MPITNKDQPAFTPQTTTLMTPSQSAVSGPAAWHDSTLRWAMVHVSADLLEHADPQWWLRRWQAERIQGVVLATGAHYAKLSEAAVGADIIVLARVETANLGTVQPDLMADYAARDIHGQRTGQAEPSDACVSNPAFMHAMASLMRATTAQFAPSGFTGHGWCGMTRNTICFCSTCSRLFDQEFSHPLPTKPDWSDPSYRQWISWSYAQRVKAWNGLDETSRAIGGPTCRWVGIVSADRGEQAIRLQDVRSLAAAAPMFFSEGLTELQAGRFRTTIADGNYLSGLGSLSRVVLTTPLYKVGKRSFPNVSGQSAECRLRVFAGVTSGMQPCFENGTGPRENVRAGGVVEPLAKWHDRNESYLVRRTPLNEVGLVWSTRSNDFYGRDYADLLCDAPYRGWVRALSKANDSFRAIHQDNLPRSLADLSVLVLPNVASMSDGEIETVKVFVAGGGTLIATGETSLYDAQGEPRLDYGLAQVFGAHLKTAPPDRLAAITWFGPLPFSLGPPVRLGLLKGPASSHDFLRLSPEKAAGTVGPHKPGERNEPGVRHPILAGFDNTDVLPFGGVLQPLNVDPGRSVLMTLVPPFPSYPIDLVYTLADRSDIPGLIVGSFGKGRVAFLPADIDRRYGIDPIPDHKAILENLLRWATNGKPLVTLQCAGSVSSAMYRQKDHLLLHLINHTGADNQPKVLADTTPVGPINVQITTPVDLSPKNTFLLADRGKQPLSSKATANVLSFTIPTIADHALILIQ